MSSLIGNRYGEAFFEAGRDENCLDSLYDDVRLLEGVLEDNDDFMKIMTVPSIPKEEQSCWWIKTALVVCRIRWESLSSCIGNTRGSFAPWPSLPCR